MTTNKEFRVPRLFLRVVILLLLLTPTLAFAQEDSSPNRDEYRGLGHLVTGGAKVTTGVLLRKGAKQMSPASSPSVRMAQAELSNARTALIEAEVAMNKATALRTSAERTAALKSAADQFRRALDVYQQRKGILPNQISPANRRATRSIDYAKKLSDEQLAEWAHSSMATELKFSDMWHNTLDDGLSEAAHPLKIANGAEVTDEEAIASARATAAEAQKQASARVAAAQEGLTVAEAGEVVSRTSSVLRVAAKTGEWWLYADTGLQFAHVVGTTLLCTGNGLGCGSSPYSPTYATASSLLRKPAAQDHIKLTVTVGPETKQPSESGAAETPKATSQ